MNTGLSLVSELIERRDRLKGQLVYMTAFTRSTVNWTRILSRWIARFPIALTLAMGTRSLKPLSL